MSIPGPIFPPYVLTTGDTLRRLLLASTSVDLRAARQVAYSRTSLSLLPGPKMSANSIKLSGSFVERIIAGRARRHDSARLARAANLLQFSRLSALPAEASPASPAILANA